MRTIGVVTGARSDYGPLLPVLRALQADRELCLRLYVTGMHLSPEFGMTVNAIEADGFKIAERVAMLLSSDTPEAIAKSMGLGTLGFAEVYRRARPDVLLVLGDRFETLAAVTAALPFAIPVAHIAGGEITEGAIDEASRHAITKMAHLHFVAHECFAERVIQMGEEPWRVHVTGEPALDNFQNIEFLSNGELEEVLGLPLQPAPLLVTLHPTTLSPGAAAREAGELLSALDRLGLPVVFTYPNADTEGRVIVKLITQFVESHRNAVAIRNLGTQAYLSLMRDAAAMVGNSSSGIIEAASFELPVVDIGDRQRGRLRGTNVLQAQPQAEAITNAVRSALDPAFRAGLRGMANPYGDGHAAARIVQVLKTVPLDRELLVKRFYSPRSSHSVGQH